MEVLIGALRAAFDAILMPFRGMPAAVGLAVVSAIAAVLILLVYKRTSDQKRIALVKRKIFAGLFEIRLFNDDAGAIFRAQGDILRYNLVYLGLSLVPLLVMLLPMVLMIAQLQFHYGYRGLDPGEKTVLRVVMDEAGGTAAARETGPGVELDVPAGLRLETPGVWIPSEKETAWRLAADDPGDYVVLVRVAGEEPVEKRVHVGGGVARRSPSRLEAGIGNQLLWPAEPPLPKASSIAAVYVDYEDAEVSFLGWKTHWMVVFFLLSIVLGFALKGVFKVDF